MTPPDSGSLWRRSGSTKRGQRILVVDDEAWIRSSIDRILSRHGYYCHQVSCVAEAISALEEQAFDLVLSDICMPGDNGLALVEYLHHNGMMPQTVIVMVTAIEETSVAVEALQRGAYGYIFKPFQVSELLVQVANALRRRDLELSQRRTEEELKAQVRARTRDVRRAHEEMVMRLMTAAEFRDNETGQHIRRLGLYAAEMGRLLGWDQERRDHIRLAAAMHDVGKVGIPDEILLKPGKLTPKEWEIMKTHTIMGHRILCDSGIELLDMADRIAWQHHEFWDGSGYPNQLSGEAISVEARIVAIVDVYDALTHSRPYKHAWPEEEAIAYMLGRKGSQFDPELLALFVDNIALMRKIRLEHQDPPQPESAIGLAG